MRTRLVGSLALVLGACGGGGGGSSTPPPPPPAPTVTLAASATEVAAGGSVVLTWSSTHATSCTAGEGWTGSRGTSGTETVTPNGNGFSSYSLICTGPGGMAPATVSVAVRRIPVVTLQAGGGGPLDYYTSTRLTWSSTDARTCSASGGWSGDRPTSGSEATALLTATTTYTLTCTGLAGSSMATVTVNVSSPRVPVVTLAPSPSTIVVGTASTLNWSTYYTDSCTASGGWSGPRQPSSQGQAMQESTGPLSTTTTYTLACTNPAGTASATATVTVVVAFPPVISISAQPGTITAGSSATLTWASTDATSCTASGGWSGTRPTSGSASTGPLSSPGTTFMLTCSGPGGSSSGQVTVYVSGPNNPPVADAGADQSTLAGATVTLSGARSSDPGGSIAGYAWAQQSGRAVTLGGANTATPSFTAPAVTAEETLVFSLVVTDDAGATSAPDSVAVIVRPLAAGTVPIAGHVTFARVPATITTGLDFAHTRQDPARGITVLALDATTQAELARGTTDASGGYALAVAPSTSLIVRAVAEMVRSGASPTWRVEVRDASAGAPDYTFDSGAFGSGTTGATRDLAVPSGWDPVARVPNGTRAAAPFAVLDTIYRAQQLILGALPAADFAPLVVDWSTGNKGEDSSFYSNGVNGPRITLAGEAAVDTDEYDAHVIAHEFGHYIEDQFSRSDSIGGPHAIGDRLDPRVAFGEGFGYAFAAMALSDPLAVDTFGVAQQQASYFDVESTTSPTRGWYSESSVWEILWDLYDARPDFVPGGAQESLALGFAPLWQVLAGPQRSTAAVTSIFPFITALKAANPAASAAIDTIVSAQQIQSAGIDAFGSTETNSAGSADVLPIHTPIAVDGGAVTVRSLGIPFGTPNKLSNHRFLRLDTAAPRSVRIVATAPPGRRVDLVVYERGIEVDRGETAGNEDFTVALPDAGTYVLDVYECSNAGCFQGTPADTDLTVTVTSN